MESCSTRLLPLLVFLLAAAGRAAADTILLRNGNLIQGEVIEDTPERLTVRFSGGVLHLPRRDVLEVRRESRLQYLLQEGEAALRRDDPESALAHFRRAEAEDPECEPAKKGEAAAREKFAASLWEDGLHRRALEEYRGLLKTQPGHTGARAAVERIESELREAAQAEEEGLRALAAADPGRAVELLRKVYSSFPDRRTRVGPPLASALIKTGEEALSSGRLEEAESRYLEAAGIDPDQAPSLVPPFAFARARRLAPLAEKAEWGKVVDLARDALRIAPHHPLLSYFLALGLEGQGKTRDAAALYADLAGLERPLNARKAIEGLRRAAESKVAVQLSRGPEEPRDQLRMQVLPGGFSELESEHFITRHRNAVVGAEVSRAAEEAYARLHEELGCRADWLRRCTITLFPTSEEFQEATGQLGWTGGAHRIARRAGVLTDHQIFSHQLQPRLTSAVIPHEVAHAVLAFRLGYGVEPPLWLNEGFAMHWEPTYVHRYYARLAQQAARERALIPLERLLSMGVYPLREEEVKLFYAQSHTLVELLLDEKEMSVFIEFARELSAAPGGIDRLLERNYRIQGTRALAGRWLGRLLQG